MSVEPQAFNYPPTSMECPRCGETMRFSAVINGQGGVSSHQCSGAVTATRVRQIIREELERALGKSTR